MLQAPHSYLVVPLRQPPQLAARRTPSPPYRAAALPTTVAQRLPTPPLSPVPVNKTKSDRSRASVDAADVLAPGDIVAAGRYFNGELVREVSRRTDSAPDLVQPGNAFEVVRKLGTGSYAVVYHVRERLDHLPDSDDDASMSSSASSDDILGPIELGSYSYRQQQQQQQQQQQHHHRQSQPQAKYGREFAIKCLSKANLGEEALQAQLQEATIHQSLPFHNNIVTLFRTLESDSLLLLLLELVPGEDLFYFLEQARDHQSEYDRPNPSAHDLSVTPPTPSLLSSFHPQQLLSHGRLRLIASMFAQMCDAVATCHEHGIAHRDIKPENFIVTDQWTTAADGSRERRVVVKLTDFGLATTDAESADMECGSAPYMSYECRNNLAPTYFPRPADVWSLGIVLINMLYHRNPWSDTSIGVCTAFGLFRENAVDFFLHGFPGMTREIAEFLAESVFCILDSPDDTRRVAAHELGAWVKNLPTMMAPRRPSVPAAIVTQLAEDGAQKRTRKRGARKGKAAAAAAAAASLPSPEEDRLDHLASANQDLVRELSRMSTRSSVASLGSSLLSAPPVPPLPASPQQKPSRWKSVFSLQKQSSVTSSASSARLAAPPPLPVAPAPVSLPPPAVAEEDDEARAPRQMSATVSNVSNLIMSLSAPTPDERGRKRERNVDDHMPNTDYAPSSASPSRVRNVSPLGPQSRPGPRGSSFTSDNWRNSMMSSRSSVVTGAGSSYTRFSNASTRSVSTANTSVSASSWRTSATSASGSKPPPRKPAMVKDLTGIPWVLHEAPRQLDPAPFRRPVQKPPANARSGLSTITEVRQQQQQPTAKHSPPTRSKLSVSTTSMDAAPDSSGSGSSPPHSPSTPPSDSGPKKVNKGQINALAKMLSALKSR